MHELFSQPASFDLQPFVRAYAQREFFDSQNPVTTPMPARLEQTLEFQFGDHIDVASATQIARTWPVTVVGPYTEGSWAVTLKNRISSFGIFFQPTGLSYLFRIPPSELSNRHFDASDVLPAEIGELHNRLAMCSSFSARVLTAEQFLRALAACLPSRGEELGAHAAGQIFRAHGTVRLPELAAKYRISARQLERHFQGSMGITPKLYARVARFQSALDRKLLAPNRSWLAIALLGTAI